jgi:hypothetical protein
MTVQATRLQPAKCDAFEIQSGCTPTERWEYGLCRPWADRRARQHRPLRAAQPLRIGVEDTASSTAPPRGNRRGGARLETRRDPPQVELVFDSRDSSAVPHRAAQLARSDPLRFATLRARPHRASSGGTPLCQLAQPERLMTAVYKARRMGNTAARAPAEDRFLCRPRMGRGCVKLRGDTTVGLGLVRPDFELWLQVIRVLGRASHAHLAARALTRA